MKSQYNLHDDNNNVLSLQILLAHKHLLQLEILGYEFLLIYSHIAASGLDLLFIYKCLAEIIPMVSGHEHER